MDGSVVVKKKKKRAREFIHILQENNHQDISLDTKGKMDKMLPYVNIKGYKCLYTSKCIEYL